MDNNSSLVFSFVVGCLSVLFISAMLFTPGCEAVRTCLNNTDPSKNVLCERVIQNQFPLRYEYPNDEKTAK